MSCWNGHVPHMTDAQINQAIHAYYQAEYARQFSRAWGSPLNPLREAEPSELPEHPKPHRTTSLAEARPADRVGAIDVEYVRVR